MNNINDIPSVFIDNDKPEMIIDVDNEFPKPCPKPEPIRRDYCRRDVVVNRPHSDNPVPGPFVPDYGYCECNSSVPNPVPNTYLAPGHHHHDPHHHHHHCHPDRNPIPMEPECDCYVTRRELNRIVSHIAEADIFKDLSENGTTVSVGGIKKGTKFNKITFSRLIQMMLYPEYNVDDEDYACETANGRTVLNSTVKYPIGDLKEGDSLKGMTVSQILEAMLCGKNKWGIYMWKSNVVTVNAGTTTLDAEVLFPKLVEDYDWRHKYELLVVCKAEDSSSEDNYVYNEMIAEINNKEQKTNVTIEGVPADTKWSYNPESKKITLHTDTEITTGISVVLIRR